MTIDDGCKHAGQVAVRLYFIEFAGLDEWRKHRPVLRTGVATSKERIISLQGDGADRAFNGVAIHLDAAIGQEQD